MIQKKIILCIFLSSGIILSTPPKERMELFIEENKNEIRNTAEGALAGICVGLVFGGLCSVCNPSITTTTTLCCITGACFGLTAGPINTRE